ncbi:SDR family NAD(P)-dependent oxidoreductase [Planktomarina temperata]|nr:SDR family NAD(P)-dependent oxidoreductase [Planktomarina temperata]MDC1094163.1 SDR family NAD(P)-dependent oxidoreductase [Planktomarina temperata]
MKTILITGASRGLGLHLTKYFWSEGYSLILVARNLNQLKVILAELPKRTDQTFHMIQCDLSDFNEIERLSQKLRVEHKDIDVVINNAAIQGTIGGLCDVTPLELQRVFNVNLFAPMELCRVAVASMKRRNSGSIINISGGGGPSARVNFHPYSASKAALIRFSENLSQELKYTEITVNCVAPGVMKTEMMKEILEAGIEKSGAGEIKVARNALENSDENYDNVTSLINFLMSPASNGITGKLISAKWDNWREWPKFIEILTNSDVYTLGRIVGRDRNFEQGDI